MDRRSEIQEILDQVARRGRGRLIADLVRRLGAAQLALAEDVAHEAILLALKDWPYRELPEDPLAWLHKVAVNKAIDRLRREGREEIWTESGDRRSHQPSIPELGIADPELRLLFLICQHVQGESDRLALMLSIAGGFTAKEIASLFLESESATSQRLARAKRKFRERLPRRRILLDGSKIDTLLDSVLSGIYLSFAVGYAPRKGDRLLRTDACLEALRLARVIADDPQVANPKAGALAALMCFHTARLPSREGADGCVILLKDQDRSQWDRQLIAEGHIRLIGSQEGDNVSQFHIEAGLSAVHSAAERWEDTDWDALVRLYRVLAKRHSSPIVTLGLSVALAEKGEIDLALTTLDSMEGERKMPAFGPFHLTKAHVFALAGHDSKVCASLTDASNCDASAPIEKFIAARLTELG